jgi:DNA-damage-inducible protein J
MKKSAFVRARIEPNLKQQAENILHELGISPTQAVTMLYKHVAREHNWPIDLKIPNQITINTFEDSDNSKNLVKSKTADEMFEKLGI